MFNFNSVELLKIFFLDFSYGLCLWNKNYIIATCKYRIYYIYKNRPFFLESCSCTTIKKFIYPEKGECLIAQDYWNGEKIFIFE